MNKTYLINDIPHPMPILISIYFIFLREEIRGKFTLNKLGLFFHNKKTVFHFFVLKFNTKKCTSNFVKRQTLTDSHTKQENNIFLLFDLLQRKPVIFVFRFTFVFLYIVSSLFPFCIFPNRSISLFNSRLLWLFCFYICVCILCDIIVRIFNYTSITPSQHG